MTFQDASPYPQVAKLTVEDFLLLDRSGAFDAYRKTELIDGEILYMNAQHSQHFITKNILYRRIADVCDALDRGIEAWSEGSVAIPPHDVPEPDIFVTSRRPSEEIVVHDTVLLVVEVGSTTLDQDMGSKRVIYATAAIPEYWVVDVGARVFHQMWQPRDGDYAERSEIRFGSRMISTTIQGLAVGTEGL